MIGDGRLRISEDWAKRYGAGPDVSPLPFSTRSTRPSPSNPRGGSSLCESRAGVEICLTQRPIEQVNTQQAERKRLPDFTVLSHTPGPHPLLSRPIRSHATHIPIQQES